MGEKKNSTEVYQNISPMDVSVSSDKVLITTGTHSRIHSTGFWKRYRQGNTEKQNLKHTFKRKTSACKNYLTRQSWCCLGNRNRSVNTHIKSENRRCASGLSVGLACLWWVQAIYVHTVGIEADVHCQDKCMAHETLPQYTSSVSCSP